MTATAPPDSHPDSLPDGPADDVERVDPAGDPGRENVEGVPESRASAVPPTHDGSPLDPPGIEDGVAGTGGVNKSQEDVTS